MTADLKGPLAETTRALALIRSIVGHDDPESLTDALTRLERIRLAAFGATLDEIRELTS